VVSLTDRPVIRAKVNVPLTRICPNSLALALPDPDATAADEFAPSLEVLLVPGLLVAAVMHAPVGSMSGQAVGLGIAFFDEMVLGRAHRFLAPSLGQFVCDHTLHRQFLGVLEPDE
jgi:hypothetical protein